MSYKVFICHNTKDFDIASTLSNSLNMAGIEVYVAEFFPKLGESLPEKIEKNIQDSDCVLVIWTKNGSGSAWVNQEIGMAYSLSKLVIPLVEENAEVKGVLEGKEYVEFNREDSKEALNRIYSYLLKLKIEKYKIEIIFALVVLLLLIWLLLKKG